MSQPNPYEAPQEPIGETIRKKRFPIKRFLVFLILLGVFLLLAGMFFVADESVPPPKQVAPTSNP